MDGKTNPQTDPQTKPDEEEEKKKRNAGPTPNYPEPKGELIFTDPPKAPPAESPPPEDDLGIVLVMCLPKPGTKPRRYATVPKQGQRNRHHAKRAEPKSYDELLMMLAVAEALRQAAMVLGVELDRRGLNRHDASRPPSEGLSEHHKWCAAKGATHFNLHQAVESIFKPMLALERTHVPRAHNLSALFGLLSPRTKADFRAIYNDTVVPHRESFETVCTTDGRIPQTRARCRGQRRQSPQRCGISWTSSTTW